MKSNYFFFTQGCKCFSRIDLQQNVMALLSNNLSCTCMYVKLVRSFLFKHSNADLHVFYLLPILCERMYMYMLMSF